MRTKSETRLLLATLFLATSPMSFAAEDDEVVVGPIVANPQAMMMQGFGVAQFDQMVFQNVANAQLARQHLQNRIDLQLAELGSVCQLSDSQKQKLQLAARGDLHRFLEEVAVRRQKFDALKNDPQAINEVWQEIQPLQLKMARGLTGSGSLLLKVIPKTLTQEQSTQYDAMIHERRLFRYRASIAVALHMMEETIALTQSQREALTEMLLTLPPPQGAGQYDFYLVIYRLSDLPPEKIHSLLDDRRWAAMKRLFEAYRASREVLIMQGMLLREDLIEHAAAVDPEAQP